MKVKVLSLSAIFGALALSGCAMQPMTMEYIASLPDTELCVDQALATLYGPDAVSDGKTIPIRDIQFEMGQRGQPCEPRDYYFQIAQARVQQEQQRQQNIQNGFSNLADYLQRQQAINNANRPVVTNCTAMGNSATCTTY